MKMSEMTGKSPAELNEMMGYLKKELFNLRFQRALGEMTNPSRFREIRRDVARIKTQMNQIKKAA